jgi:hypothetical protein
MILKPGGRTGAFSFSTVRRSLLALGLPKVPPLPWFRFSHAMLRNYDMRDQESRDLKLEGEIHLQRTALRPSIYHRADPSGKRSSIRSY